MCRAGFLGVCNGKACAFQWYFTSFFFFFLSAVPLCKCSDSSFVCKSSAVEIQLVNQCRAVRSGQFWKAVIYDIKAGNRKSAYGRSCCRRSSLWLGELEHGLLNLHLWESQEAAMACHKKLSEAEKNGKNPERLIIILKLKCSCLSQRGGLDAVRGHWLTLILFFQSTQPPVHS